jgi:membrane protease YdiL (CAAX protease family)
MPKMSYRSGQLSITNPLPTIGSAPLFGSRSKGLNIPLFIETFAVAFVAILAIRLFPAGSIFQPTWFVAPGILTIAALVPTVIKHRDFPGMGFNTKHIGHSLLLVGWACLVTFPAMVCGLWLMRYWGFELPMRMVKLPAQGWFCWLFYQFMYVGAAEEIFFRGYVQNNILKTTGTTVHEQRRRLQWASIIISAGIFAVAHIIVQGEIVSVLTLFPGLVLGWLFIRTRSLLAPILFHGLANTIYFYVAALFV